MRQQIVYTMFLGNSNNRILNLIKYNQDVSKSDVCWKIVVSITTLWDIFCIHHYHPHVRCTTYINLWNGAAHRRKCSAQIWLLCKKRLLRCLEVRVKIRVSFFFHFV